MKDWLAKAHPDAPALPWRGDAGGEICSFAVVPLSETGGMLVVLFDAHGREVVRSGGRIAIEATALALGAATASLLSAFGDRRGPGCSIFPR